MEEWMITFKLLFQITFVYNGGAIGRCRKSSLRANFGCKEDPYECYPHRRHLSAYDLVIDLATMACALIRNTSDDKKLGTRAEPT